MINAAVLLLSTALSAQAPAQPGAGPGAASTPCARVSADALTDVAVGEVCAGDDASRSASLPASDDASRNRAWQTAADHYRRAATLSSKSTTRVIALSALADVFQYHLGDMKGVEGALRELAGLVPDDPAPLYRLAKAFEEHRQLDAAEDTLLLIRRQQPDAAEPFTALASFYSRQAMARRKSTEFVAELRGGKPAVRVGGQIRPPTKVSDVRPVYPPDALAAGIRGVVILEATIGESGGVEDARVLRSIPALDDAAVQAVRQWQFTPTMMNGQPVPVVMTVTVNFTLPEPSPR